VILRRELMPGAMLFDRTPICRYPAETVFREMFMTCAACLIGMSSALRSRRISAPVPSA